MDKKYSYLISGFIVISIIVSLVLDISLIIPFLLSIGFSFWLLVKNGFNPKELLSILFKGFMECKELYFFLLLTGANISVWMASGIVPTMMFYGFQYLEGTNFIFMAFLLTTIMTVFMGTGIGTISTLGIALIGVGRGFGIPTELLLGVLVSGAFLSDKLSPISGMLNLTMQVIDIDYKTLIKGLMKTFIPVFAFTSIVYFVIGTFYTGGENSELIVYLQSSILDGFVISPWLLLLPLLVVLLPMKGITIVPTVLTGIVGGVLLTLRVQGVSILSSLNYMITGYQGQTSSDELNSILISGGMLGMVEVVAIIGIVLSLSNLLEKTGVLKPLIYDPIANVKSKGELIFKTGIVGTLLTIITCDQAAGVVLPGKLYKNKYKELGIDKTVLARTLSDSSTIIAPLMPWNVNGMVIGLITGVSAFQYAPYAILCYIFPLVAGGIYISEKVLYKISIAKEKQKMAG
ncbi:Na+/H+ antiporter NhaC family protein [Proteinivorax hydrogeniformans]|uniref:Na+/H+ antiporter NhaC family protein n=1 Tax=Proteinivorax hydrogeniformans TaxID=1826727 RepID=A0AAU8HVL2_9FIRM